MVLMHGIRMAMLSAFSGAVLALAPVRTLAGQATSPELPRVGTRIRLMLEPRLSAYQGGAEPPPHFLVGTLVSVDTSGIVVRRLTARHVIVDSAGGTTVRHDSIEMRFPTTGVLRVEISGTGRCGSLARRVRCAVVGAG